MKTGYKVLITVIALIAIMGISILVFFNCTTTGKEIWNEYIYSLDKKDEISYETRKSVEDTCRAMISQYSADKLIYEQYKDSDKSEEQSWAAQAKMRANQTASTYNNYILKNNYVWKDNIPSDIYMQLPVIM